MRIALAIIIALACSPLVAQAPSFDVDVESASMGSAVVAVIVRATNSTGFVQTGIRVQCRGVSEDGRVLDLNDLTLPSMQVGETVYREVQLRADTEMRTVLCEELR